MEMPDSTHEVTHAMNRLPAGAIGTLNALIAIVLLSTTVVLFVSTFREDFGTSLMALIAGLLGTVAVCGLIAIMDDIRVTLHEIRDAANQLMQDDAT